MTSVPHVAGTKQDLEQAEWVRDRFIEAGLDEVKLVPYEVLLSYPRAVNKVSLLDNRGIVQFETSGKQPGLASPEEFLDEILPNFSAYSTPGIVEVINFFSKIIIFFIVLMQINFIRGIWFMPTMAEKRIFNI